ncbi:hypothetical protein ES703_67371 [subsurface metagenome]
MKRIGLLALALVLALGGLGIGYANWTDEVKIIGTVQTSEVDLEIIYLSNTYVYKNLDNGEIVIVHELTDVDGKCLAQFGCIPTNPLLVGSAVATKTGDDDEVTFTYVGIFPCVEFWCDVVLHYSGMPAHVVAPTWKITKGADWLGPLVDKDPGVVGFARTWDEPVDPWPGCGGADLDFRKYIESTVVDEGYQLHDCNYIWIGVVFHLPQDNTLMNKSGEIVGTFGVEQWNAIPEPAP